MRSRGGSRVGATRRWPALLYGVAAAVLRTSRSLPVLQKSRWRSSTKISHATRAFAEAGASAAVAGLCDVNTVTRPLQNRMAAKTSPMKAPPVLRMLRASQI